MWTHGALPGLLQSVPRGASVEKGLLSVPSGSKTAPVLTGVRAPHDVSRGTALSRGVRARPAAYGAGASARTSKRADPLFRTPWATPSGAISRSPVPHRQFSALEQEHTLPFEHMVDLVHAMMGVQRMRLPGLERVQSNEKSGRFEDRCLARAVHTTSPAAPAGLHRDAPSPDPAWATAL